MNTMPSVPPHFVGREAELDALQAHARGITDSAGWIDVISGEPGIGKSSLLAVFEKRFLESGGTVHLGRCIEGDSPSCWPWVEVARSVAKSVDLDAFAADARIRFDMLDSFAPGIMPRSAVEEASRTPAFLEQKPPQFLLYQALYELFRFAAAGCPTAILIEDLHWADEGTCDLLRFFARGIDRLPIHIVCTYRNTDVNRISPIAKSLGTALASSRASYRRLEGFTFDEIRALLRESEAESGEAVGAGDLDERSAAILVRTDGNPLLVRALIDSGAGDRLMNGVVLPENVRHLVGQYLGGLTAGELDILGYAAVLGEEYPIARLARVLDPKPIGEVMGALDAAVRRGLLLPIGGEDGSYRFRHDVVRQTVIDDLGLSRRVDLHAKCAEALERLRGKGEEIPASELFHHFSRSEIVHGEAKTDRSALEAGREALRQHDAESVIRILEPRVKSAASRDPALGAIMYAVLGPAYIKARGRKASLESRRSAFMLAVGSGSPDTIRRLIEAVVWPKLVDEETVELAARAVGILKSDPKDGDGSLIRRVEASLHLRRMLTPEGIDDEADRCAAEAARSAAADGELEFALDVMRVRALQYQNAKRHEDQLAEIRSVRKLVAGKEDEKYRLILIPSELEALMSLGRFDEAADLVSRVEPVCLRHADFPEARGFLKRAVGWYVQRADWPSFERLFEATRSSWEADPTAVLPGFRGFLELDRLEEARELFVLPPSPPVRFLFLASLPAYLIRTGNRSIAGMMDPSSFSEVLGIDPMAVTLDAALRGFVAWTDGDIERLRAAIRNVDPGPLGSGYETFGFLHHAAGNRALALELCTKGLEKEGHHVPNLGWLMFRLATLQWKEDRRTADEWLEKAKRHAAQHGLKLLSRRITEFKASGDVFGIGGDEASIADEIVRKDKAGHSAGLTEREVEVLREAAKGRTDAEIADTLFISTKTVSTHVGNILRKTGCANRTEAARFAVEHGIIPGTGKA